MVRTTSATTDTMSFAREPLPKTTAIQLFKSLYLAQRSEEHIVKHYPENLMRTPMHMSMGQEFVCVGSARRSRARPMSSPPTAAAAFLAQTHDTDRFFSSSTVAPRAPARARAAPCISRLPIEHILSSGVVAARFVAVGAAASRQLKTGRTAVVFFGDGACDAGVFWESVNAAFSSCPCCSSARTTATPSTRRARPVGVEVAVRRGQAVRRRHLRRRQRRRRERLFARQGSRQGASRSPAGLPQHQVLPLPRARRRHGLELGLPPRRGDGRARMDRA